LKKNLFYRVENRLQYNSLLPRLPHYYSGLRHCSRCYLLIDSGWNCLSRWLVGAWFYWVLQSGLITLYSIPEKHSFLSSPSALPFSPFGLAMAGVSMRWFFRLVLRGVFFLKPEGAHAHRWVLTYPLKEKDFQDVSALCKKFGIDLPAAYAQFNKSDPADA